MSASKKLWRFFVVRPLKKRLKKRRSRRQAINRATTRARKVTTAKKAAPAQKRPAPRATAPRATTPGATPAKTATPRGANPLNVVRQYQRSADTVDANRAASLKEKNDIRERRAKSKATRDAEKARARAARQASRDARVARAETRVRSRANPPVIQVLKAPVTQRKPTAAELGKTRPQTAPQPASAKCGATCDDGTPCENPSLGETCAAGHNPKTAKKPRSYRDSWTKTPPKRPDESDAAYARRHHATANIGAVSRTWAREDAAR